MGCRGAWSEELSVGEGGVVRMSTPTEQTGFVMKMNMNVVWWSVAKQKMCPNIPKAVCIRVVACWSV